MATSDNNPVADLVNHITVYQDIGVDSEGRAHLYDPRREQIAVATHDVRGERISESDIVERIGATGRTVEEYARFVRDDVDGIAWDVCEVLE